MLVIISHENFTVFINTRISQSLNIVIGMSKSKMIDCFVSAQELRACYTCLQDEIEYM